MKALSDAARAAQHDGPTRAQAGNRRRTDQSAEHTAEIIGGEPARLDRDVQLLAREHRRQPAERRVDREQREKERDPKRQRVAHAIGLEQRAQSRLALERLFGDVDEHDAVADRTRHALQQASELAPAPRPAHQEARRFRQQRDQHEAEDRGQRAAEPEQHTPAERRQDVSRIEPSQHAAQRHAHDGRGDRKRPPPRGRQFRRCRGGARQRASDPEARQKAKCRDAEEVLGEPDAARRHAEQQDAADDRRTPAETVADITCDGAAEPHTDQARHHDGHKILAAHTPFLDDHRDRETDQLPVEPIEHDGDRREQHAQLLEARPRPLIDALTDIDGRFRRFGHAAQNG
jgi:hypothetical protein